MSEDNFTLSQPQPLLIVISGPSGVGKDTIIQRMKARNLAFQFVITATTRPPRPNEVHGRDYFFYSQEEFAGMIARGDLLEYALVYNDYKGIPKQQVREALSTNKDVVMRLDVQGAETIRRLCPEALLIFLSPQDEAEMIKRLKERKTETPEDLQLRIATARHELTQIELFDYVVVNRDDCQEETVEIIFSIITAEHHRVKQRKVTL
ncbi:MAG: guanylate kinase [Anaerolineales bacterium]|nr:MAG: guanylate kinase [Anaerolineales bacterium]